MVKSTHEASRTTIGLGSFVSVQARAPTPGAARDGVARALEAVALVERLMHPERGSDLRAIRSAAAGTVVEVHPWTHQLLSLSRRIYDASEGRFDPCLPEAGRFSEIEIQPGYPDQTLGVLVHAAVHLDLGGIAKGFAADRALDELRSTGCESGLVNCGGDVAVYGHEAHRIACVDDQGQGTWVLLINAALASSDTQQTARPPEHRGHYDGRDRSPVNAGRVTVKAPTAAVADALTKCLLAGIGPNAAAWLAQFDAQEIRLI